MHELQSLGEALTQLSDERLDSLALPERLHDGIREFRRTRSHEGRRRQLQYIGKLMRGADSDAIREAIAASRVGSARETLALHRAEQWRDRLLADDAALALWIESHVGADTPQLRALVKKARQESASLVERSGAAARKGPAFRALFQFIRDNEQEPGDE